MEAHSGRITCITGPNGGGKSTLIEIIAGMLEPDTGQIRIQGRPYDRTLYKTRLTLGYVPDDEHWFIKELCAQEYFALLADIYQRAGKSGNLIAAWQNLAQRLSFTNTTVPIQSLSHGNKKKVQIIAALMHDPALIVVDEIRNGLDPLAIITVEQILTERAKAGSCVIAATHDLWWAERIANTILVLKDGAVLFDNNIGDVYKKYPSVEAMFMSLVLS